MYTLTFADERVRVSVLVEIAQSVVDFSVFGFVCPDVEEQVTHRPVAFWHVPISHRNLRRFELLPLRQLPSVNICNGARVGNDGFLLEKTDKAVANPRRHEVSQEEAIIENSLGSKNHGFHEPAWLSHLHERQEVHTLVVCFLQQCFDPKRVSTPDVSDGYPIRHSPSIVSLQASQTVKMTDRRRHHPWNTCYTLQEEHSYQPFALRQTLVVGIAGSSVHTKPQQSDHHQRHSVPPIVRGAMSDLNQVHLLLRISVDVSVGGKYIFNKPSMLTLDDAMQAE